jgi:hypothetical protein
MGFSPRFKTTLIDMDPKSKWTTINDNKLPLGWDAGHQSTPRPRGCRSCAGWDAQQVSATGATVSGLSRPEVDARLYDAEVRRWGWWSLELGRIPLKHMGWDWWWMMVMMLMMMMMMKTTHPVCLLLALFGASGELLWSAIWHLE